MKSRIIISSFILPHNIHELTQQQDVPQKKITATIEDLKIVRAEIIHRIRKFREVVNHIADKENKDDFFRWFWHEAYVKYIVVPEIVKIDKKISTLRYKKISLFPTNQNSKIIIWENAKIKAKHAPLEEIASSYLSKQRHSGNYIVALCPFHKERTPSFYIYTNTNTWHCFGACSTGGDSISFLMKIENISFKEAVRRLSSE